MLPAVASLEGRVTNSPPWRAVWSSSAFHAWAADCAAILTAVSPAKGSARHGTLEIGENFGRARETIHCRRLRLSLSTLAPSKAAEVVGGFDHVDSGTRCVTYVDACIQNVNWTDVPVCPSSGVAATDGSLNRREVSGNGTSFTRPHRTPGTSNEWRV